MTGDELYNGFHHNNNNNKSIYAQSYTQKQHGTIIVSCALALSRKFICLLKLHRQVIRLVAGIIYLPRNCTESPHLYDSTSIFPFNRRSNNTVFCNEVCLSLIILCVRSRAAICLDNFYNPYSILLNSTLNTT